MNQDLAVITGMSGSGKSIALHALEDAGYYCVDNLPLPLLEPLLALEDKTSGRKLAVAMDVRGGDAIPRLPYLLDELERGGVKPRLIFLDTNDDTLIRRFSATRRRHPLSRPDDGSARQSLIQAIARERNLLCNLRERAHVIDTSFLRPAQLMTFVKQLIDANAAHLTLVLESFAFKHGITQDADYVFDVRMLPNPFYEEGLRNLTGLDQPVIDFLRGQPQVDAIAQQIT
ncbi:MAG: RNase adapter RapZ, partial [Burkholderiaceae bacterium]|nr:RNase adapter RapZ [Burkholderiaceae bacterium]